MKYKGEIGLFITAVIWGMGFVASDVCLDYMTPYQVMALRFLISSVLISLVFFKKFKTMDKMVIRYGCILGTILCVAFTLQIVGLKYTTPSKNAFLTAINVIIVPFIGFFLYRRKLDGYGLVGALCSIVGIAVLSIRDDLSINIGDVLTIGSAVLFALHIFYTCEFLNRGVDAIGLTVVQMIVAAVLSLGMVIIKGEFVSMFLVSPKGLLSAVYLGIFSTTIAFLLQTISQKYTTETKAAIILCTESVFGSLLSILILHDELTLRMGIGCVLIMAGVLVAEVKPRLIRFAETS